MQFHSIIGRIVAPIVPYLFKQIFLEFCKLCFLELSISQRTNIDISLGSLFVDIILVECLVKLFDSEFSTLTMKHSYAHITLSHYFVIVILSASASTMSCKIFPTFQFNAYTTRLIYIVKCGYKTMKTISILNQLIT